MSINYANLKTELNNDPAALGYAPFLTSQDYVSVALILNFVRDGSTACPVNNVVGASITVFRNDIAPKEIVNAIATADFAAATQLQISKLELMFVAGVIDATLANVRGNMQSILSGASTTTTNAISALAQRKGSRTEQLFGTATQVNDYDIRKALSS